jgi:hypothetical protein
MSCPYFEENYFGICCASVSRYLPGIETMERYCFRKLYRLCPTLLSHRGLIGTKEAS